MARYAPEHKEATRRRMLATAGRRFKHDGIDGSGIATLVADAGLTNGAFYGHFASKSDLVASVVAQQLADQAARVDALPAGLASVELFLREYLSPAHRDDPGDGCPSAALLDEISRCDVAVRRAYTDGADALVRAIARHLHVGDDQDARDRAVGLFAVLVASIQLARAVSDRGMSDQILAAAYSNAMTIAEAVPPARYVISAQPPPRLVVSERVSFGKAQTQPCAPSVLEFFRDNPDVAAAGISATQLHARLAAENLPHSRNAVYLCLRHLAESGQLVWANRRFYRPPPDTAP